jgi:TonB-dependent SusC/RagA subfamily outer membrane receptor
MPFFFLYLLKVSVSLAIVWTFYQLLLRRLTFYNLNRWYLLGYSFLCYFIPLVNIGPVLERGARGEPLIVQYIPAIGEYGVGSAGAGAVATAGKPAGIDVWSVLPVLIVIGAGLLLVRFAVRWFSIRRIRRHGKLVEAGGIRIYHVAGVITPFSFGNAIYINPQLHNEKEWEEIILHEFVHIRQKHSLDILFAELQCIVGWFNPFTWLVRYSIRQNLEFIADRAVLENGVDKKGYQYHLLKVVGQSHYRLANNFNFSSLKKRIIMMNKIRSARLHLVKFLFILPLIGVLLVAFRNKYDGLWKGDVYVNTVGIVVDGDSKQPLAGVNVQEKNSGLRTVSDERGFYQLRIPARHDSVRIRVEMNREGYAEHFQESFFPAITVSRGMIINGVLFAKRQKSAFFIDVPVMGKCPDDPGYADALSAFDVLMQQNKAASHMLMMKKENPEVVLFYTTEDKKHQIVFRKGGGVEKYGFPGGPTVEDMEKKYGALPEMMKPGGNTAGAGYLSQWEAISAAAAKAFHTTNPDVREVVFPGDSRVITVLVSGRVDMYDMDSDDPKERPAFEKLYGKLPDCVPAPSHYPARIGEGRPYSLNLTSRTVPADTGKPMEVSVPSNVLFVVDGVVQPAGFKRDSIPPDKIYAMEVIKGEEALRLFGEKGANGVIAIMTKAFREKYPPLNAVEIRNPKRTPLYIVDGVEMTDKDALQKIDPAAIESMSVLKDAAAKAVYGEKGANGVILITLKKKAGYQPKMTIYSKDGPMSIMADSIVSKINGEKVTITADRPPGL